MLGSRIPPLGLQVVVSQIWILRLEMPLANRRCTAGPLECVEWRCSCCLCFLFFSRTQMDNGYGKICDFCLGQTKIWDEFANTKDDLKLCKKEHVFLVAKIRLNFNHLNWWLLCFADFLFEDNWLYHNTFWPIFTLLPTWRIIPVSKWLITMVSFCPLRIGLFFSKWPRWLINGGDPNHWT